MAPRAAPAVIRRAQPDDARAIATVHVRSWKGAYPGLIPQSYLDRLRPEDRLAAWGATLRATCWPRAGTFVAVDPGSEGPGDPSPARHGEGRAGAVAGFACFDATRDPDEDPATVGELQTLYVDPDHWGLRYASALMAAVVDEMAAGGYRTATLWVLATNARARRRYEHLGWAADGATKLHDWGEFVATDVRYRRPLP